MGAGYSLVRGVQAERFRVRFPNVSVGIFESDALTDYLWVKKDHFGGKRLLDGDIDHCK